MRAVARFSVAIAFHRDRRHRWRQVSVGGSSAVVTVILLFAVSLVGASLLAQERAVARQAPAALRVEASGGGGEPPEGVVAKEVSRATVVEGRQVATQWIQPLRDDADDLADVPWGLSHTLEPGEAVLSPRLVRAGISAEDLGWESSDAGTGPGGAIGDEGLAMASDLVIYVRPVEGMDLGNEGAVRFIVSYRAVDPRAETGVALDPEVLAPDVMLYGATVFLLIPALILLASSSRARSPVRDDRLTFLHLLGVRRRTARLAMGIENGALGAVGALCGAVTYALVGPFLSALPFTTIRFFPGDLAAPWWAYLMATAAVATVATLCGVMGRLRGRRAHRSRSSTPRIALMILVLALAAVIASALPSFRGPSASTMYVIGSVCCIAAMPFAVPRAVGLTAARLASVRGATLWATARRLLDDPIHLSRMASVLSVLVVVSSLAVSMWGAATATQAERSPSASAALLSLDWREPGSEKLVPEAQAALDEAGVDAVVLPLVFSSEDGPGTVRIPDCEDFAVQASVAPGAVCGPGAREDLSDVVEARTGYELWDAEKESVPDPIGPRVLVLSAEALDTRDVQKVLGFLPALNLRAQPGDLSAPLPLVQWIMAGGLGAFAILVLAVARELGDRTVEDREREIVYRRLGLGDTARSRLSWCLFLIPALVATAIGFASATVLAYAGAVHQITDGDVLKIGFVSVVALVVLLGTITIAMVLRRAAEAAIDVRSR